MTIYQWRAFIGPRYEQATSASAFEYWTPANLEDTAALDATLTDGATTITLDNVPFDAAGGAWIGPNSTGEAWEYVTYTGKNSTQLTGCTREPSATREHNGVHTAGATVRQWWLLEDDSGTLILTEELNDALSAITWTARIEGIKAPIPALRGDHAVVIQTRARAGAWATFLIGFTRAVTIRDDYRRQRQWQLEIVSIAGLLNNYQAPGIKIGAGNIARFGDASTDTELADWRKEAHAGEYTSSAPDLSGASAIDDDPATLWIAERFVGTPSNTTPMPGNDGDNDYAKIYLSGARLYRWPGEAEKTRWMEWTVSGRTFTTLRIINSTGNGVNVSSINGWSASTGDTLIICEDEATFRRYNPLAEPTKLDAIGSAFFDALDMADDAVGWYYPLGASIFSCAFSWGGANRIESDGHQSAPWPYDPIPAPGPGQVIRYSYDSGWGIPADHFIVDYADMAGYQANDGVDPWIMLVLPAIDLQLEDDITDSSPGAGQPLYLVNANGERSTIGLSDSGTIQIGNEQITYSARDGESLTVSARGANSTTAAAHDAGDIIYAVISGGYATRGRTIERIEWERSQAPYPESFKLYYSILDEPRPPTESGYTADWTLIDDPGSHAALTYGYDLSPAARASAILFTVDKMSDDPARPRLNDLRVFGSIDDYPAGLTIDADTGDDVILAILDAAGANVDASSGITTHLPTITQITTEAAPAWTVIADMADYSGVMIDCERAGTIAISENPYAQDSTITPAWTLDEDDIAGIDFVQQATPPAGYVRQPWVNSAGIAQDDAEYPTTHSATDTPITLKQAAFQNATQAGYTAKRRYIMLRYPVTYVAQLATANTAIRAGDAVGLTWDLGSGQQEIDRTAAVMAADHELSAGRWTTVLQLRQVDREAAG